ncbi:MAG: hypothetical protein LWY06_20290 [Firmicutes bacterium]|nr:hypothetical protein [Bacillota bacterium]
MANTQTAKITEIDEKSEENSTNLSGKVKRIRWSPDGKAIYYLMIKDKLFETFEIRKFDPISGKTDSINEGPNYADFFFIKQESYPLPCR